MSEIFNLHKLIQSAIPALIEYELKLFDTRMAIYLEEYQEQSYAYNIPPFANYKSEVNKQIFLVKAEQYLFELRNKLKILGIIEEEHQNEIIAYRKNHGISAELVDLYDFWDNTSKLKNFPQLFLLTFHRPTGFYYSEKSLIGTRLLKDKLITKDPKQLDYYENFLFDKNQWIINLNGDDQHSLDCQLAKIFLEQLPKVRAIVRYCKDDKVTIINQHSKWDLQKYTGLNTYE